MPLPYHQVGQYKTAPFKLPTNLPYGAFANTTAAGNYPIQQTVTIHGQSLSYTWPSSEHAYHAQKIIHLKKKLPANDPRQGDLTAFLTKIATTKAQDGQTFMPKEDYTELVSDLLTQENQKALARPIPPPSPPGVPDSVYRPPRFGDKKWEFDALCDANFHSVHNPQAGLKANGEPYTLDFMREVIRLKLEQYPQLRATAMQMAREGIIPIEVSRHDDNWASGVSGSGLNMLGVVILEEANKLLIANGETPAIPDPNKAYKDMQQANAAALAHDQLEKQQPNISQQQLNAALQSANAPPPKPAGKPQAKASPPPKPTGKPQAKAPPPKPAGQPQAKAAPPPKAAAGKPKPPPSPPAVTIDEAKLDEANALSDHHAQCDVNGRIVSQNLQGPYGIKRKGPPDNNFIFDLPFKIGFNKKDPTDPTGQKWIPLTAQELNNPANRKKLAEATGLDDADCGKLLESMVLPNDGKETAKLLGDLAKDYPGLNQSLGYAGNRFSIETDAHYEARMDKQIAALKASISGGADILSLQEQPYDDKDPKRMAIFAKLMAKHGYQQVASLKGRDVGIWVKKELAPKVKPVDQSLANFVAQAPYRGAVAEIDGRLVVNIHVAIGVAKDMDELIKMLITLKEECEKYANDKGLEFSLTGDANLYALTPDQQGELTKAGFEVDPVKGQEKFENKTCEAWVKMSKPPAPKAQATNEQGAVKPEAAKPPHTAQAESKEQPAKVVAGTAQAEQKSAIFLKLVTELAKCNDDDVKLTITKRDQGKGEVYATVENKQDPTSKIEVCHKLSAGTHSINCQPAKGWTVEKTIEFAKHAGQTLKDPLNLASSGPSAIKPPEMMRVCIETLQKEGKQVRIDNKDPKEYFQKHNIDLSKPLDLGQDEPSPAAVIR